MNISRTNFCKNLFFLFLLLLLFFINPANTLADENFSVSYDLFYRFKDDDNSLVTQKVTVVNKQTNLYALEYSLSLYGQILGEISGFDESGPLQIIADKKADGITEIKVIFNRKTVGVGSKFTFTINYTLSGLVNKVGRIKELSVPRPADNLDLLAYNVVVFIPKSYGPIGFVKPVVPINTTDNSFLINYQYSQAVKGILIGTGDYANFEFNIAYHIKNNSLIQRRTEIAIPPDTRYQKLVYKTITPKPVNVNIDQDGNWLAVYDLNPKQQLDISVSGNVLIYSTAQNISLENAPDDKYLKANKFWEVDNDEINKLKSKFKNSQAVYDYVSDTLNYNFNNSGKEIIRLGALQTLKNTQSALCMDYTDLFITLNRAIKVPAREATGFAYTSDKYLKPLSLVTDILHAWPEYWDETSKAWKPADPTWTSTSGGLDYYNSWDFNHFVFVRRGISSTYPVTPGTYKIETTSKDVEVKPVDEKLDITIPKIDFNLTAPSKILFGRSETVTLNLINIHGSAIYSLPVNISAENMEIIQSEKTIDMPPFSKTAINAQIKQGGKKFWGKTNIIVTIMNDSQTYPIEVEPLEVLVFPVIVFVILVLIISIVLIKNKLKK